MPERTRRLLALGGVWAIVTGALAYAPGCTLKNCEPSNGTYGRVASEGRLVDENTWESGPVDGPWMDFSRQRLWLIDFRRDLGDRIPVDVRPYISAQRDPFHEGGNFTVGAGNLAEISGAANGQVAVRNGTCADYFLRVVVEVAPRPPADPPDASTDAPTD